MTKQLSKFIGYYLDRNEDGDNELPKMATTDQIQGELELGYQHTLVSCSVFFQCYIIIWLSRKSRKRKAKEKNTFRVECVGLFFLFEFAKRRVDVRLDLSTLVMLERPTRFSTAVYLNKSRCRFGRTRKFSNCLPLGENCALNSTWLFVLQVFAIFSKAFETVKPFRAFDLVSDLRNIITVFSFMICETSLLFARARLSLIWQKENDYFRPRLKPLTCKARRLFFSESVNYPSRALGTWYRKGKSEARPSCPCGQQPRGLIHS